MVAVRSKTERTLLQYLRPVGRNLLVRITSRFLGSNSLGMTSWVGVGVREILQSVFAFFVPSW